MGESKAVSAVVGNGYDGVGVAAGYDAAGNLYGDPSVTDWAYYAVVGKGIASSEGVSGMSDGRDTSGASDDSGYGSSASCISDESA